MHGLTLVFDLDGTLVDTAPDLAGATNHALQDVGLAPVTTASLRPWVSFGARRMIVEALAMSKMVLTDPEVDKLLDRFLAYYEANIARESRPFAGCVEVIDRFRLAGCRLAVCTNKREALSRSLLTALGMLDAFHGLAGRDTFANAKPHPDHVLGAIRLARGRFDRAIMIGDSKVDIDAARAAGIPVVGCSFGYSDKPVRDLAPDRVVDGYAELEAIIGHLAATRVATEQL